MSHAEHTVAQDSGCPHRKAKGREHLHALSNTHANTTLTTTAATSTLTVGTSLTTNNEGYTHQMEAGSVHVLVKDLYEATRLQQE